jgi:hypothetical protein
VLNAQQVINILFIPLVHYQNLFRLLINGKKRKGAIQIFIETIFKAQENQIFSILTKLKLRALKM